MEPDRAGRAGQPAGPHRGGCDLRARFPLTAARRAPRSSACSAAPPPGPASARRCSSGSATPTTRRSTSSRIRTPGTIRAPRCSRLKVLFRKSNGAVLGAQALGEDGRRWTSASARWPWPSRWARPSTTWKKPSFATRPSSAAPRIRSTSPGWSPPMCCAATCRSVHWDSLDGASCSTCASLRAGRGERAGRAQYPAAAAPQPPGRTAPRPRDPRHLPLRPARLLRDAHPAAERLQGQEHLRRHAVARHEVTAAGLHGNSMASAAPRAIRAESYNLCCSCSGPRCGSSQGLSGRRGQRWPQRPVRYGPRLDGRRRGGFLRRRRGQALPGWRERRSAG